MLATSLLEALPAVLGALAGVIASCAALVSAVVNRKKLNNVEKAVNTRPPGSLTISDQISQLASRIEAEDIAATVVLEAAKRAKQDPSDVQGDLRVPDENPRP